MLTVLTLCQSPQFGQLSEVLDYESQWDQLSTEERIGTGDALAE